MPKEIGPEVRDRVVRMELNHQHDYSSVTAAAQAVTKKLNLGRETASGQRGSDRARPAAAVSSTGNDSDDTDRDSPGDAVPALLGAGHNGGGRLTVQRSRLQNLARSQVRRPLRLGPDRSSLAYEVLGDVVGVFEQEIRELSQNVSALPAGYRGLGRLCASQRLRPRRRPTRCRSRQ